ncbi:hypothetical protein AB1N83_012489 [Pleurotus pulmonarius]
MTTDGRLGALAATRRLNSPLSNSRAREERPMDLLGVDRLPRSLRIERDFRSLNQPRAIAPKKRTLHTTYRGLIALRTRLCKKSLEILHFVPSLFVLQT